MPDGTLLPVDTERSAAQGHRRGMSTLAGQRDQAAEQEGDDDADDSNHNGLGGGDAEAEEKGSVAIPRTEMLAANHGQQQLPRTPCSLT